MRFSIVAFSRPILRGRLTALLACGIVAALCTRSSNAQDQTVPVTPAIRSTAELVKLDVSVLDKHGDYIAGLTAKDFHILDNNSDRVIEYFAPVDAPARVLVIVETSPAVYLIQDQHLAAAYSLLQGLGADDEVALISYDSAPHPLLSFTSQKSELVKALGNLQYMLGSGHLNLFDSISTAIDWLAPVIGKKEIVLLTTGLDSSPPARWDALVAKLRAHDVVIYSVALGGPLRHAPAKKSKQAKKSKSLATDSDSANSDSSPAENPVSFQKADAALESLASITGGQVYFPSSPADFTRIYREIASALRHQYVLGVAPAHDGQFHTLTVQASDPSAQRIFVRQGYLAPPASAP